MNNPDDIHIDQNAHGANHVTQIGIVEKLVQVVRGESPAWIVVVLGLVAIVAIVAVVALMSGSK